MRRTGALLISVYTVTSCLAQSFLRYSRNLRTQPRLQSLVDSLHQRNIADSFFSKALSSLFSIILPRGQKELATLLYLIVFRCRTSRVPKSKVRLPKLTVKCRNIARALIPKTGFWVGNFALIFPFLSQTQNFFRLFEFSNSFLSLKASFQAVFGPCQSCVTSHFDTFD